MGRPVLINEMTRQTESNGDYLTASSGADHRDPLRERVKDEDNVGGTEGGLTRREVAEATSGGGGGG